MVKLKKTIQEIGKEGEELFKSFLNDKNIPYLEISQENDTSFSGKAKDEGAKRPDFIIPFSSYCNFINQNMINNNAIIIDVKHYEARHYEDAGFGSFDFFCIDKSEIKKALSTEELYNIEFWFIFKDNKATHHYDWYAIKVSDIDAGIKNKSNTSIYISNPKIGSINIKTTSMKVVSLPKS